LAFGWRGGKMAGMSAAYRVKYEGPNGDCPDAVVTFHSDRGECVAELASEIKERLVKARGGQWDARKVIIREIAYIGPWFYEASDRT
jgi:hypothetical protein